MEEWPGGGGGAAYRRAMGLSTNTKPKAEAVMEWLKAKKNGGSLSVLMRALYPILYYMVQVIHAPKARS
jgi:hypothetical protein